MKHFFLTVLNGIRPSYILKCYVIGGILYALLWSVPEAGFPVTLFTLNLLLFPFAMYACDSLLDLFFGNMAFISSILFAIICKVVKVLIVFALSILLAPIGLLIMYFVGRGVE